MPWSKPLIFTALSVRKAMCNGKGRQNDWMSGRLAAVADASVRNSSLHVFYKTQGFTNSPVASSDSISMPGCPDIEFVTANVTLKLVEANHQVHGLQNTQNPFCRACHYLLWARKNADLSDVSVVPNIIMQEQVAFPLQEIIFSGNDSCWLAWWQSTARRPLWLRASDMGYVGRIRFWAIFRKRDWSANRGGSEETERADIAGSQPCDALARWSPKWEACATHIDLISACGGQWAIAYNCHRLHIYWPCEVIALELLTTQRGTSPIPPFCLQANFQSPRSNDAFILLITCSMMFSGVIPEITLSF